jgi:hypothetical protein
MTQCKLLFSILLFCFGGLAVFGQSSPLKAEIVLVKTTVKNNTDFYVKTVLRNTGDSEQSLEVLYCCYSVQWASNNPSVHVDCDEACMNNSPGIIKLKPGQTYEKKVPVHVELRAESKDYELVTFRLGFQPASYRLKTDISRIWSNALMVSVTR